MYQDESREVAVPDGFVLVPDPQYGAAPTQVPDWCRAVPLFDPQSGLEVWWSRIMRWPRSGCLAFLYLTQSWKISAVVAAVVVAVVMVCRAYL